MPLTSTIRNTDRAVTSAEFSMNVPSPTFQARAKLSRLSVVGQAERVDEDLALGLERREDHPGQRQQHEERIQRRRSRTSRC